jgi:hypothetical protein
VKPGNASRFHYTPSNTLVHRLRKHVRYQKDSSAASEEDIYSPRGNQRAATVIAARTCKTYRERLMNEKTDGILNTKEYRGCGIRALSYKTAANDWAPQACFWLHTHHGWRRLWIASFAHCFARPDLTFARKIDADAWACRLARELIDRTLPEFTDSTEKTEVEQKHYIRNVLKIVRRPLSAIHVARDSKYRN